MKSRLQLKTCTMPDMAEAVLRRLFQSPSARGQPKILHRARKETETAPQEYLRNPPCRGFVYSSRNSTVSQLRKSAFHVHISVVAPINMYLMVLFLYHSLIFISFFARFLLGRCQTPGGSKKPDFGECVPQEVQKWLTATFTTQYQVSRNPGRTQIRFKHVICAVKCSLYVEK